MDFLITQAIAEPAPAPASAAGATQDPGIVGLIFPLAILAAFFFLFVLPQQRRGKEHRKMLEALIKGAEVVTNGGLVGRIAEVEDSFIKLEIADNIYVQVQKTAVSSLLPKGTYKVLKQQTITNK